ncbi:hypothetical protein AX17_001520 [Amanita inopinata Kibby_2008]|nr:hypothetical protein AX17_001520 [Amanita inopinata Kibby_2008]
MAPRLRSAVKRERELILRAGGSLNTQGLPALPVELLLEIVSYARAAPIPCLLHRPLPVHCLERNATLRILSQICCSLRNTLLPVLWERIEACTTTTVGITTPGLREPRWWKDLATDLVAQLETVTVREPSLASYVRIVNVAITPHCTDTVIAELARCLAVMPNLHTVQLLDMFSSAYVRRRGFNKRSNLYREAFSAYTFPSVRRIVLPWNAYTLLSCFPEVRRVHLDAYAHELKAHIIPYCMVLYKPFVKTGEKHYQQIERFEWTSEKVSSQIVHDAVIEALPSLRRVRLYAGLIGTETFTKLAKLKRLDTIELVIEPEEEKNNPKVVEQVIQAAQKVLADSPLDEQKTLIIKRNIGVETIKFNN